MLFRKTSVGIKISDHTAEAVALTGSAKKHSVVGRSSVVLPQGAVEHGRIKNADLLKEAITTLFSTATPKPIVKPNLIFAIPDVQVFFHVFTIADLAKKDIEASLHSAILRTIPILENELVYSYKVIERGKQQYDVMVAATRTEVAKEWKDLFVSFDAHIDYFDLEPLAAHRAFFRQPTKEVVCIADIGSRTTNLAFFDVQGLRYTQVSHVAGNTFTKALTSFATDAEAQKRAQGLQQTDPAAAAAVEKVAQALSKEIGNALSFYEKTRQQDVTRVILTGGASSTQGLVGFLKQSLGRSVELGTGGITDSSMLSSLGAYGAALRGIDKKWSKNDMTLDVSRPILVEKKTQPFVETKKFVAGASQEDESLERRHLGFEIAFFAVLVLCGAGAVWWAFEYREAKRAEAARVQMQAQSAVAESVSPQP